MSKNISIVQVRIAELRPADYNPRKISQESLAQLKESIARFEMVDPIIANSAPKRKNVVIGGHMRLRAAKELGHESVPVVYVDIPNIKKEQELNLRLNRNLGEWDFSKLKSFDIEQLLNVGFDDADLSSIWDENLETEDDGFDEAKALAEIKKPTVKFGEYYQLGDHFLACIDSTDESAVRKLAGKHKMNMVDTDPPFNIFYSYRGKNGKYGGQEKDDKSLEEYRDFLRKLIKNGMAVSKPDAHYLFFADERWVWLLQVLYQELGIKLQRLCIWLKDNAMPTPKIGFNKATEFAVYGTTGTPYINADVKNLNTILNKEVGSGNRAIDDVIDLFNIWLVKRLPAQSYDHPTQKSPTLYEKALRRLTRPGDCVLDLTAGSGTLMAACHQMKRRAFLCESDPLFATLIKNRYEKLSNKKAKKLN